MNAREAISEFFRIPQKFLGEYPAAEALIEHLRTREFTILHDSENHGPTRDRAAGIAEEDFRTQTAKETGYEPDWYRHAKRISSAIRAMEVKP